MQDLRDVENFVKEYFTEVPTWLMEKAYLNDYNIDNIQELTVGNTDEFENFLPYKNTMFVSENLDMDKFITENAKKISEIGLRIYQIDVSDRIVLGSDQWQINQKGESFMEAQMKPFMDEFNKYMGIELYDVKELKEEFNSIMSLNSDTESTEKNTSKSKHKR